MTDPPAQRTPRLLRRGTRAIASAVSKWVEPEENPWGVIYGTLAVGAVLAAESSRRETFPETIEATLVILALYWLAHTYATLIGDRLKDREPLSAGRFWRAFLHEAAIVKGGLVPIIVLSVLWGAGISLQTGVTAAVWASAAALVAVEVLATARSRVTGTQRLTQIAMGALLGAGVLWVRAILH